MTISSRDRWLGGAGLLLLGGLLMAAGRRRCAGCRAWIRRGTHCALAGRAAPSTTSHPFTPHESLPAAAVLAGLGMLLIAASGLMLIGRRRIKPWLSRLTLVIMMTKPLVLGAADLDQPGDRRDAAEPERLAGRRDRHRSRAWPRCC